MKPTVVLLFLAFVLSLAATGQQQQPDKRHIRIVDTLTTQEKSNRNPVITKAEMDSLGLLYSANHPVEKPLPVKEIIPELPIYWIAGLIVALVLIFFLLYNVFAQQRRATRAISGLNKQLGNLEMTVSSSAGVAGSMDRPAKEKGNLKAVSEKGNELEKLQRENQSQEVLLKEYRFIKQEYESIKQQITDAYKIRNYPGYDKSKSEQEVLEGLLQTEKAVAAYSYEHFLKPVIAITDAHKNNPAKIGKEDRDKVVELLLSLSLLYIEYLYLRVNELAIGGKIAERIAGFRNGNTIDPSLLKELNTEHGSRALVLRMILDQKEIKRLSYPVFDETDLNLS